MCWDEGTHVILFPSFGEYPDFHHASRTDLKNFVSRGNNLVFLGGFSNLAVLNDVFGYHLKSVSYQEGPFYKSDRSAHNTPFEAAPRELPEVMRSEACEIRVHHPFGYDPLFSLAGGQGVRGAHELASRGRQELLRLPRRLRGVCRQARPGDGHVPRFRPIGVGQVVASCAQCRRRSMSAQLHASASPQVSPSSSLTRSAAIIMALDKL